MTRDTDSHSRSDAIGLLNDHEMPGARDIDDLHPLAQLLAQRMPIPRRRRFIIEPLDHEKGGSTGAPPIFERHVPTGREMRDKDRGPALDVREYFRIGRWREPARAQHGDAIAAIHLGLCRIAKMRADRPRRGRDEATRCKQRHGANQRRLINCQTAGDPVAEGVSDQVRRTTADRLNDASDITGQIVQGRAIEGTATAADATDIYRDRLESSGNQRARQLIKIAGATARIREQHDWCARTAKCAFQRRVTDVDASMLRQSRLPLCAAHGARLPCRAEDVSRDPASVPKLPKRGRTAPQIPPSDVVESGRYRWPKPDSIPKRASVLSSDSEYYRVHAVGLRRMRSGALGARSGL